MASWTRPWDYLIVTASNAAQAQAYERQLDLRRRLGLLAGAGEVLVAPDPGGKRVGSGGSTLCCLAAVLQRRLAGRAGASEPEAWLEVLRTLRILIVHAGGDSRRLPAYGPCGKIFVPVPGESDSAIPVTLFDRQLPTYLGLPAGPQDAGQVVVTAGDVLLSFDAESVSFDSPGMTGLACRAEPHQASRHGVYCPGQDGRVRLYMQKPSPDAQRAAGAVDRYGQSLLDIGVLSFDAATAVTMLRAFEVAARPDGRLAWSDEMGLRIESAGLDIYREVCCAMGDEVTPESYLAAVRAGGSAWDDVALGKLLASLSATAFSVRVLPRCGFLHFGTTRQIISSGLDLLQSDHGVSSLRTHLSVNNDAAGGQVVGEHSWVEGCRIRSAVRLGGENVLVGVDVDEPLDLPRGVCLDVLAGADRCGKPAWFVRCYGVDDTFKDSAGGGATFFGMPVEDWMRSMQAGPEDIWPDAAAGQQRTLWDARLFPAVAGAGDYRQWLWLGDSAGASDRQRAAWRQADRYSLSEIANLTDHAAFHSRRRQIRSREIGRSLRRMFRTESGFSAGELACVLGDAADRGELAARLLAEAQWICDDHASPGAWSAGFGFSRIMYSLAWAVASLAGRADAELLDVLPGLDRAITPDLRTWLETLGLVPRAGQTVEQWTAQARAAAFRQVNLTIVASGRSPRTQPHSAMRTDEIVWGRAPARLDLGGGWSDTPPYSLEWGGCVLNAAVNLNGQPPIQVYGRVIGEPVIRIGSIDLGTRIEVADLDDLLGFGLAQGEYALAKAALAISGFSGDSAQWKGEPTLPEMLERFGGGIELTTLAAIPKGSGLGTSSIIGAVILAVVNRLMGREMTSRELFHGVLRLEQSLTTGGGWQDQVGGAVGGVKLVTARPGLVPDPSIHYVPADVLDPKANDGCTLLYYTGITRLAKNILQNVVGRYLARDRAAMATLREIHAMGHRVADAMARKDLPAFGRLLGEAWRQNKQLDPDSSNGHVEEMLARVGPHIHGAKLLGAGGGGFLLMVCRSTEDARAVRRMLEAAPPNGRARFFDFDINQEGCAISVC
jgi:galactokinase/mevalonate kinase-like predicted kinase